MDKSERDEMNLEHKRETRVSADGTKVYFYSTTIAPAECCPVCGSDQVEGEAVEVEGGTCYQNVRCKGLGCGLMWTDTFRLVNRMIHFPDADVDECGEEEV